jgi:hypothetical protein
MLIIITSGFLSGELDVNSQSSTSAGHSRKQQRTLANYRRDLVFSLSSQGYNQPMIANKLRVSQAVVSMDLSYLRKQAAESLSNFLSHKLPLIYQECYESISQVVARTPMQAKVALLSLIKDATEAKMELSSGGEIIEQGIAYSQNVKNRYVEITKTNDILHDDDREDGNNGGGSSNNGDHNVADYDNNNTVERNDEENNSNKDNNNNSFSFSDNNNKNNKVF